MSKYASYIDVICAIQEIIPICTTSRVPDKMKFFLSRCWCAQATLMYTVLTWYSSLLLHWVLVVDLLILFVWQANQELGFVAHGVELKV